LAARPLVRRWAPSDILPLADGELAAADRRRGAEVFAQALCFRCHRLGRQGGATGPDLTSLAGRFNTADLLEAVLQPSRHVSDQYRTVALSLADGRVVTGKVKDISGNTLLVTTDPFDPGSLVMVPRDQIDELRWSETSPMPAGLLDSFTREEIVALAAYLLPSPTEH
jgi:putative heme-binding domain-containing protein